MSKAPTLEQALAAAEVLHAYAEEESSRYTWGSPVVSEQDRVALIDASKAYERRMAMQGILAVLQQRKIEADAHAAAAPKVTTLGDLMLEDIAANEAAWNSPEAVAARAAEIDAARALLAASKVKRPRK